MQVEQLHTSSGQLVAGPLLITPQVFGDDRGIFYESWNQRRFDEAVGVLTLSERAEVLYKASGYWSKSCERSLLWNDPDLSIAWPLEALGITEPLLAEKDADAPTLAEAVAAGEVFG